MLPRLGRLIHGGIDMKNIPVYFKIIFTTLFCLLALFGCGGENNIADGHYDPKPAPKLSEPINPPEIDITDPETQLQIIQDYHNLLIDSGMNFVSIDGVKIAGSFGVYNGYAIVLVNSGISSALIVVRIIIDGVLFVLPTPAHSIIAWKEGQILELKEARDLGLLSREDLTNMAGCHDGYPTACDGSHTGLSIEAEDRANNGYLSYLNNTLNLWELTIDDVWIEAYYGTYGNNGSGIIGARSGLVAVMIDFKGSDYACAETEILIGDILFRYNNGNRIIAWTINDFLSLQEAYDSDLLTKDDLVNIANLLASQTISCNN